MAKCTKNVPKVVVQPPATYTLELSQDEADVLAVVLSLVGGRGSSADTSRVIREALKCAGVNWFDIYLKPEFNTMNGDVLRFVG